jgi:hypothetical protein
MKTSRRLALLVCGLLLTGLPFAGRAAPQGSPPPDLEKRVKALVGQLGDRAFARREAAHKALLKLGDGVVPLLEKLGRAEAPEVQLRIARIRRDLVGYRDDIRTSLAAMPEDKDGPRKPIPEGLKRVIAGQQPKSGDYLLAMIADPKHPLRRRAVNAFTQTWDSMSAAQLKAYLSHVLALEAQPRARYPQGVDAGVGMLYHFVDNWAGLPADGIPFHFATRTRHLLDGKPYGKPFAYQGPGATTGWIWTKDLALGKHSCGLELEYTFTHRGEKVTGRIRSRDFTFMVVAADTPDDLVAPKDAETDRLVRRSFRFIQKESDLHAPRERRRFDRLPVEDPLRPQVTWEGPGGKRCGLSTPYWKADKALPVDLCFEVTLIDQKTGRTYRCDPLILRRGQAHWGYIYPRDVRAFARGRSGDVPVKAVLRPSRKTALSTTDVTHYWPGSITSEVLTIRVYDNYVEPVRGARK